MTFGEIINPILTINTTVTSTIKTVGYFTTRINSSMEVRPFTTSRSPSSCM